MDGGDPAEVIQPGLLEAQRVGIDADTARDAALERDRDVAEADGPVSGVDQRLGDDPDRIGEVDQPGAGCGPSIGQVGELEHDGHGPECLRQPAGTGRLLPDGPEAERQRLVGEARHLAPDPQLDEHEARAVDGLDRVGREGEVAGPFQPAEHAIRQATDDGKTIRIEVLEHQLVDRQSIAAVREALDELRGVGASTADDGDLDAHRSLAGY
jgi:hypothetical protein